MAPESVTGRLVLAAPPRPEPREGLSGLLVMAIPMLGSLGSIVVVTTMGGAHTDGRQYVAAGMFLLATVGFVVVQADRQRAVRRDRTGGSRAAYARHLSSARATLREAAREQQRQLRRQHPDPAVLPTWAAEGTRVWERGPADPLFLQVRWGLADQPLALELVPPEESATDAADPASAAALERLLAVHRVVPDCPVTVDLRSVGRLAVAGDRALARAVVCSAAALHAPDHLAVAVLADAGAPGSLGLAQVAAALAEPGPRGRGRPGADGGHVARRPGADAAGRARTSCSCSTVSTCRRTTNARGRRCSTWPRTAICPGGRDRCSLPVAEAFARRLTARGATPGDVDLEASWAPRSRASRAAGAHRHDRRRRAARARPQGVRPAGDGPARAGRRRHRVGQVGAAEDARAAPRDDALARAAQPRAGRLQGRCDVRRAGRAAARVRADHQPRRGARARRADAGRAVRRAGPPPGAAARGGQPRVGPRVRRGAGRPARTCRRCRRCSSWSTSSPSCSRPSPSSSTCSSPSDGSAGRSGCTCCSPRSGWRRDGCAGSSRTCPTGSGCGRSARRSRGPCSASRMPTSCRPCRAWATSGPTRPRWCGSRRRTSRVRGLRDAGRAASGILPFTIAERAAARRRPGARRDGVGPRRCRAPDGGARTGGAPDLAAAARRAGAGRGAGSATARPLVVPVGTVDRPREQRRDALVLDLSGSAGHVAVVGGPRSGKSTLVQTIAASLALGSTPLGDAAVRARPRRRPRPGGGAAARGGHRDEDGPGPGAPDRRRGARRGRRSRGARSARSDRYGEVFLVVDGWSTLRSDFDDLEAVVQQIAMRGLAHGVHVVATATRWSDFRPTMRDLFGTRLELRLGDPVDSEIDRRAAALVPGRPAGSRPASTGCHFLGALPTFRSAWTGAGRAEAEDAARPRPAARRRRPARRPAAAGAASAT